MSMTTDTPSGLQTHDRIRRASSVTMHSSRRELEYKYQVQVLGAQHSAVCKSATERNLAFSLILQNYLNAYAYLELRNVDKLLLR
jgi:hypothetical protein